LDRALLDCGGPELQVHIRSMRMDLGNNLLRLYEVLRSEFGPQHWWPADGPFEVMVGAILTQNTNWANVEKAIRNLKREGALDVQALAQMAPQRLQALIRPAGYYRQKAVRLRRLALWVLESCSGQLERLGSWPTEKLKEELVAIRGIGPETADSILLYALDRPVFVVDAYTKRVMARHQIVAQDSSYFELQSLFEDNLPEDLELYKDYHAQFVRLGKIYCRRKPRCEGCPVRPLLGPPELEEDV